jgi:pimeloyl-ACP methyl ester carboxylesterase
VVTAEFAEWTADDGQRVAVVARYPDSGDDLPVVVLCHGLGGSQHGYAALGTHLASHGYAVLHPRFADAGESSLALLFDPKYWLSRVTRVHAVINSLAGRQHLPIRLRADNVIVAGHSFGAYTAQLLVGTRLFEVGPDFAHRTHPAVAGGILLSPQGSGDRGLTPHSWDGVDLPLLVVTATHDRGARGEGLEWRREPFDRARSRLRHLAVVRGGDHQLGGLPEPEPTGDAEIRTAVAAVVTGFADRVHGDRSAGDWLAAGPFPTLLDHAHREDTACPTT